MLARRDPGAPACADVRWENGGCAPLCFEVTVRFLLEDPEVQGYLITMVDVTALRTAEGRLRVSETRTRALFESAIDSVMIVDEVGRILEFNRAAKEMFGYRSEEVIGRQFAPLFFSGHEREAFEHGLATYIDKGMSPVVGRRLDLKARRKDGVFVPVEVTAIPDRKTVDGSLVFTTTLRDVNERVSYEQRLQQALANVADQKTKLEAILSATNDGMVFLRHSGHVLYANRSFGRILNFGETSLVGLTAEDLAFRLRDRRPAPVDSFERVLGVTPRDRLGLPSLRCDTGWPVKQTLLLTARPVMADGLTGFGRLAVFRDITKEEEARRAKDDLISNVSHELRTPLTSIRGFVDLVRRKRAGPLTEKQERLLGIVTENVDQLTALVTDLLAVDGVENRPLALASVDLVPVLRDVIASERPTAKAKGLSLLLMTPPELIVEGDGARLCQVFTNLVANAVKYTRVGVVNVRAIAKDKAAVIEVQDTGIGMSPQAREQIFERFFRAHDEYVRGAVGTGLGLSITRTIVERHGGKIDVESEPGEGSQFRVLLPVLGPQGLPRRPHPLDEEATCAMEALRRPRVLVVDHDRHMQKITKATLAPVGLDVRVASTGRKALEEINRERPDLVVLEIELEDLNGWEILERLRQDAETERVPVLVITAKDCLKKALRLGAEGFLRKPLNPEMLRRKVLRLLLLLGSEDELVGERS